MLEREAPITASAREAWRVRTGGEGPTLAMLRSEIDNAKNAAGAGN